MTPIYTRQIPSTQPYAGRMLTFDPDSSPEAWKHYQMVYGNHLVLEETYDLSHPRFFNYVLSRKNPIQGVRYGYHIGEDQYANYVDKALEGRFNRLYALPLNIQSHHDHNQNCYFEAANRLSGDVDFNFNEKHFPLFERLLWGETDQSKRNAYLRKLEDCKKMHHSLLNFSLMQTVGNLQGFKGDRFLCDERFDVFLFFLSRYYETPMGETTAIVQHAAAANRSALIRHLDSFKTLEHYCRQIYFIQDVQFIQALVESGKKPLDTPQRAMEYIDLARQFWSHKQAQFARIYPSDSRYVEVYHGLFPSGGETYTLGQLELEAERMGLEANGFIQTCLDHGWIHDCGNGTYTK